MEIKDLASKQARVKFWREFIKTERVPDSIKVKTESLLKLFTETISKVYNSGSINSSDIITIEDLERQLEDMNELARMSIKPLRSS